jgi:hypothetical protein
LCTDEPTPAPVTPIDNDGDAVTDLDPENIVVTCENTFCSDGSDGTSCSRYGSCCPAHSSQRKIITQKKNVIMEPLMKMHMITKSFATTRWCTTKIFLCKTNMKRRNSKKRTIRRNRTEFDVGY